jgi:membrane protein
MTDLNGHRTLPDQNDDKAADACAPTTARPDTEKQQPTWRRLASRTLTGAWDDDIFSESASSAFWQTLSLPPLLLGLFGALGWVGHWFGPDTVVAVQQWIVSATSGVFSKNAVEQIISPTVTEILTTARGEVVSVGFVLSLWSGSSAMASFVDAITRAHGQYQQRNLVWQRILSVLLYTCALVVGIVVLPAAALGPRLLPLLPDGWEPAAAFILSWVYTPVIALALIVALTTLYKIALPFKPPWYRGLPGALFAAVVFFVGATGLRIYLDWLTGTGYTYGALAAPIAFLLATFFIALGIIGGAHLNAAVQTLWPAPLRRRGEVVNRGAKEKSDATVALDTAVGHNPEAAAAALERLNYIVTRP